MMPVFSSRYLFSRQPVMLEEHRSCICGLPYLLRTTQGDSGRQDALKGSYLGTDTVMEIMRMANKYGAIFSLFENEDELLEKVSKLIAEGM